MLHVPLDEFSLVAIRCVAGSGEFGPEIRIPSKPTMSFVQLPEYYSQLQQLMRGVADLAGVPPISIDLLAWNVAHGYL